MLKFDSKQIIKFFLKCITKRHTKRPALKLPAKGLGMDPLDLTNKTDAIKFYDNRYSNGYMEEWPLEKRQRVLKVIKSLNLPETGDALDFGCGNGEFTGVLRQSLPKWNIYGVDISSIAIDNAKKRHPDCLFFLTSDLRLLNKKFDFLFSHHVLEHVEDIDKSWQEIDRYLKKQSSILHVLPCGNQGSFEYNLCMQRIDGVNRKPQDRFAFEEKSHLRRLTTKQMNDFAVQYNFELVFGYYSNQFYGALDWITLLNPMLILEMTTTKTAKDKISALKLACLSIALVLIKLMRFPANTIDYNKRRMKRYKYYFLFFMLLIFYPLSKLTNICLKYMSNWEWKNERDKKNGSEMYLYYKRI